MKPALDLSRITQASAVGLTVILASGCAGTPTRYPTLESISSFYAPQPALGGTEGAVAVHTVAPEYPVELRRKGISGSIEVSCLVDEDGNVQHARVENSTNSALNRPTVNALRQWRFKPAMRDQSAVPVRVNVPVSFTMRDD